MTALEIAGATLTVIPEGISLKYGWFHAQDISKSDAIRIRDWLNLNYPVTKNLNHPETKEAVK